MFHIYFTTLYSYLTLFRPTKVILYDDMGRGTDDDSFTWNEYGRPSFYTAAAVGYEVSKGDVDAVYHGKGFFD